MLDYYLITEIKERVLKAYRRKYKPGRLIDGHNVTVTFDKVNHLFTLKDIKNERQIIYSFTLSVNSTVNRVHEFQIDTYGV